MLIAKTFHSLTFINDFAWMNECVAVFMCKPMRFFLWLFLVMHSSKIPAFNTFNFHRFSCLTVLVHIVLFYFSKNLTINCMWHDATWCVMRLDKLRWLTAICTEILSTNCAHACRWMTVEFEMLSLWQMAVNCFLQINNNTLCALSNEIWSIFFLNAP